MKVGFVSLGCPKNLVDTEVMMGQLAARGHEVTPHPHEAEVIVVNTCSFIGPAKQESVDTILEMARYKEGGQAKRLIVAGCLVERYRDEIRRELPEVDAVVGTNQLEQVAAICENGVDAADTGPYLYHDLTPRLLATPRHYAYIKIAEGCDHPCTFCVIPQFRGQFRSRQPDSVEREAAGLLAQGVRELNLIGQDTTSYGEDLGLKDGLAQLLERLARLDAPDGYWIRFLYAYPNRISTRLLETLASHSTLARYVDIPLQHSHPGILKSMKRGGSGEIFLRLVEKIRRIVPDAAIRTSLIVGYPGEGEPEFEHLCRFVEEARFDNLGVFGYSDEETSESYSYERKASRREIYNRKRRLMAIQRKISRSRLRRLKGREIEVLVEGPSAETELLWEARMAQQAPEIDGVCYINDDGGHPLRAGEFRRLRVTETHDYDVVGCLTGEPPRQRPAPVMLPLLITPAGQKKPEGR